MEDIKIIETALQRIIGQYGWILIVAFLSLMFKEFLRNAIAGLSVFFGNDISEDDIVYVNGRKARVSRVGMRKTIFYMADNNSKMIVPNERLKHLTLEKKLSINGNNLISKKEKLKW